MGIGDRQDIREKDLAKEADTRAKDQQAKDQAAKDPQDQGGSRKKSGQKPAKTNDTDENGAARSAACQKNWWLLPSFAATNGQRSTRGASMRRSPHLKSKGVPVIWVGLPPIRGARSTADAAYLNELYRARAERAGITYIDVWDGFVDEAGKYSNYGPDYEGQMRRLRLSDGVFFTKYGAAKLAHYVEHELRRYMSNRVPVALPSGPVEPSHPNQDRPSGHWLGPVIPLTGTPKDKEKIPKNLLGAPGSSPIHGDAIATKVLTKGETVAAPRDRADNFAWPQGGEALSAAVCATAACAVPAEGRARCSDKCFGIGAGGK